MFRFTDAILVFGVPPGSRIALLLLLPINIVESLTLNDGGKSIRV